MTAKYLLQLLFKALAFSVALSFALGSAYYIYMFKTGSYVSAMSSIIDGCLLLNVILTMMAFASMLLIHQSVYANTFLRFLVFFGGTVAFMAYLLIHKMSESNTVFYATCGLSFFVVQAFLYYKMVKTYPPAKIG
jgi:hypothetical protein